MPVQSATVVQAFLFSTVVRGVSDWEEACGLRDEGRVRRTEVDILRRSTRWVSSVLRRFHSNYLRVREPENAFF